MSTHHGGVITLKPISEVAKFKKNLIPANIPEIYTLKPMFKKVANEKDIRNGVIAFRDFLYIFCDRLTSDGHLFTKSYKKPANMADYPFLHNVTNLLVDIGYYSKLNKNGNSLLITEIPSCTPTIDDKGKKKNPKISGSNLIECLRFLTLCGFIFSGVDLEAKTINIFEIKSIEVSYPNNSIMLTGLKALSIADMELRVTRRYWNDNNLLRCDYRLLKAEDTDIFDIIIDFLHPLPAKLQKFALKLHQRYIDMGMTCSIRILSDINLSYAFLSKKQKKLSPTEIYSYNIWQFSYSLSYGFCLIVRAKKTDEYMGVIKKFPLSLQKIITKGYGCDSKLRNERCQHGCQGIRLPFDDSILNISKDIENWLDNEILFSRRK
jgi:hypothetical protein